MGFCVDFEYLRLSKTSNYQKLRATKACALIIKRIVTKNQNTMKRSVLFLVSLLVVATMVAAPVSQQRAMQVAQQFIPLPDAQAQAPGMRVEEQPANIVYIHPMPKSRRPAFYVVNVGGSFVIVSADDVAHQILGYNLGKNWPTAEDGPLQLPPQVKGFFDDLAAQMEAAIEANPNHVADADWPQPQSAAPRRRMMSEMPDSVGPLLTTTWDQGQYYNALCPEDQNGPDGHCLTGCVATAMAQIINYWGDQVHTRGIHSYETNYGTLEVNYDSAHYDFAHMPAQLTDSSSPQEIQAVATLMRDCGVAANMTYSRYASSAYDVDARAGLINFFCLSPDLSYAEKSFFADSVWENILRTDISANRPVMYSGHGSGDHSFVCDGYKQDGYYHFNFGWSGFCDGWYQLAAVNPAQNNFSSNQTALLDIVPDSTGNVVLGQMVGNSTYTIDEPLEFYHLLGHNAYEGSNYNNPCNNTINFISSDNTVQLVADILEFEDQNLIVKDGSGNYLRSLSGGGVDDMSPMASSSGFTFCYSGNMYYAGFKIRISQDNGCRMVSNIVSSVDTTTVHLMWTENGTATQWQIEYGLEGFSHGEGTLIIVNTNTLDITFPQRLTKYDIYIRPVCADDEYGNWFKITIRTEAPYWQDFVVSQPSSYIIDNDNNCVLISCAEDFVWYTKDPMGRNAMFISDIDLSGYKWRPISWRFYKYKIDGRGHVISSLYINEEYDYTGLFSHFCGTICDLGIVNSYISGGHNHTAGFCGELGDNPEPAARIVNCFISNSEIQGGDFVSGIASSVLTGAINNCYANVKIHSKGFIGANAGFITAYSEDSISNCYATGTINQSILGFLGGISAYSVSGFINDCYSIDLPRGVVGYDGQTDISDTSSFYLNDGEWKLRTPIVFDGTMENNLLNALNKGVIQRNDSALRMWIVDTENQGLPKFGDYYIVQCENIANLTIRNVKLDTISCVIVDWDDVGNSDTWEIKYQPVGSLDNSAVFVNVTNKPDTLYNIPLRQEYLFSVRSVCDDINHSGWTSKKELVDLPFWTEIITERPNGYKEDVNGNVTISSAEGLVWLSVLVNGLHGNEKHDFTGKTISLMADVNLEGFRWYPIGRNWESPFAGMFLGNNHDISNLYVNSDGRCLGLFGYACNGASFSNVSINGEVNCYFNNVDGGGYGGLLGMGYEIREIVNCQSDVSVKGIMQVGSLCGNLLDYEGESALVSNCQATGDVWGRKSTAGLIGGVSGIVVQNCYATGNVYLKEGNENPWYRGGLIGNFMSNSQVRNCYATGNVEINEDCRWFGRIIGCPYMNTTSHYIYGYHNNSAIPLMGFSDTNDEIADTSSFVNQNNQQILLSPVVIKGSTYYNLLDALNAWVSMSNDSTLKTWVMDTDSSNEGYPIFGGNYEPSCFNPKNVTASNITQIEDSVIRTRISWEQEGHPSNWEILYVGAQQDMNQGTIIEVTGNPCELTNLPVGEILDIYVRAICAEGDTSGWSTPIMYLPDKLHWTDVVTQKPNGYYDDGHGNVTISSAEGFAWLSSVVNGLNGNREYNENIVHIDITSDIDLSAYRWKVIELFLNGCVIEGNGHTIYGLYCNEISNEQGLFGRAWVDLRNINIIGSSVHGLLTTGTIAGSFSGEIINCIVNGEVDGLQYIGGYVGENYGSIVNSSFIGNVVSKTNISVPNQFNSYAGGITGNATPYNRITNTYVAAEVSECEFSGIIGGAGGGFYSNIFALSYPTVLSLTYDNTETNSSFFTGDNTTWILNTPPYVNGEFRTNLLDALNAWVDANNSDSIYCHWAADTAMVNGGFPIFAPMPVEPVGPGTEIDNYKETNRPARKIFERGHIYILLPDGTRFDATGRKVE